MLLIAKKKTQPSFFPCRKEWSANTFNRKKIYLSCAMIDAYLSFVKTYPLISSAIQVAILGMLGELVAIRIRTKKWYFFGPGPGRILAKIVVWAFLGITFKYAFVGFFGFVDALIEKGMWFTQAVSGLFQAVSVSAFANIIFGPVMVLFHRLCDNIIEKKPMDWNSLTKAWTTLLWFWIPAHTITFSLPSHLQVGLAAAWAFILGIILGYFAREKK